LSTNGHPEDISSPSKYVLTTLSEEGYDADTEK
jgi:phosphopantothenate-cysteine ligase